RRNGSLVGGGSAGVWPSDLPVLLRDLGNVIESGKNNRLASRYNGQQVVTLTVQRQPGTNTVAVVDAIRNLLPSFRQQLPASIKQIGRASCTERACVCVRPVH